ncbi:putative cyclophilin [Neospora caninum Liverpool]|uniref:Cyclophilin, putative n=1 Tax=Neospora caninum (strain Liverpool) TaxID=572307 RepID=F0VGA0_NEOCL|nr:putative cyclophilin [Neospora caninum Liverpool]CBZ52744.1 putative cyclophilin [Neospora caninum Liverpool]CEL66725.1 TPA: cyclophilin, putative [Neospora caninum Liverpool]|eukprot:XP_003882776.1 putative cyclophilin [Neospora caninum Liverpool]
MNFLSRLRLFASSFRSSSSSSSSSSAPREGLLWQWLDRPRSWFRSAPPGAKGAVLFALTAPPVYFAFQLRRDRSVSAVHKQAIRDRVFLDFALGGRYIGRVLIGLYSDRVPLSVENFIQLCEGYRVQDKIIGYRNTPVHLVKRGINLTAGDVVHGTGAGKLSIYGPAFPDENFDMQFIQDGDVALMNTGPSTNNSQFIITFNALKPLNRNYVVIGTVLKGMRVIKKIEEEAGSKTGAPMQPVRIINCGLYRGLQDGPPFFANPDLLDRYEETRISEADFLALKPEEQEKLVEASKAAVGPKKVAK